jgi:hypothetical protein
MPVNRRSVRSVSKSGDPKLAGDVTLTAGTNVTLTQTGQDIEIAAAGGGGGSGDVVGPASSTDGAIPRYDGTTGKLIANSTAILTSGGDTLTLPADIYAAGGRLDGITNQSLTAPDFPMGLNTDTISETTAAAGVTIDGVLIKDGEVDGLDIGAITATTTELNYTGGVTSAIQTQLNNKQPLDSDLTTIAGLTATTDNVIQSVGSAWASRTPAQLKSTLALAKADVGLSNVDNNSTLTILALAYPVGSLYMNRTVSTNPATLLGFGTWTAITDKMIMARGGTYTADGGSATHSHTLSSNGYAQIYSNNPTSTTNLHFRGGAVSSWTSTHRINLNLNGQANTASISNGVHLDGSTDSDSTVPPMIVAYVWERTA